MNVGLFSIRFYDHHLGEYMRRWILQTPVGTLRLHNIRRPDNDPVMHDHPWHFASLILRGGYIEAKPAPGGCPAFGPFQTSRYEAGSVNFCPADGVHRITEILGDSCWTLVVSTRRVRGWGFWQKTPGCLSWEDHRSATFIPWRQWIDANPAKGWTAEGYDARLTAVGVKE